MKKIIATFTGDHTGFKKEFDCTELVLAMSKNELLMLEDHDHTSDNLAPESIIEEARKVFEREWGTGSKNLVFGYEVAVVESILTYFNVESLNDINN